MQTKLEVLKITGKISFELQPPFVVMVNKPGSCSIYMELEELTGVIEELTEMRDLLVQKQGDIKY